MAHWTRSYGSGVVLALVAAGCGSADQERQSSSGVSAMPAGSSLPPPSGPGAALGRSPTADSISSGDSEGFAAEPSADVAGAPASLPLPPSEGPTAELPVQGPTAGTLTAGTWDDNLNFERFLNYRDEVIENTTLGVLPLEKSEHIDANESLGIPTPRQLLDVSLVIDTTGSMGDELLYLQTEFQALSRTIEESYPNAEQRWSLVAYRDQGDIYVTDTVEFTSDPTSFRQQLAQFSAGGGGDYPEAPDSGFEAMNQLAWRGGEDVARLTFWVADAPHHTERAEAFADALRATRGQDIHVYPIASSGVDELTELTMRSAAQLTGGRYLFLTNDSGVGGDHKEPSIPCYFVTRLDTAILRMVDIELGGEYRTPTQDEIIRTGGNPEDRACSMSSGEVLFAY